MSATSTRNSCIQRAETTYSSVRRRRLLLALSCFFDQISLSPFDRKIRRSITSRACSQPPTRIRRWGDFSVVVTRSRDARAPLLRRLSLVFYLIFFLRRIAAKRARRSSDTADLHLSRDHAYPRGSSASRVAAEYITRPRLYPPRATPNVGVAVFAFN